MMSPKFRSFAKSLLYNLCAFVLVFSAVAFIVTCSFLVLFITVDLPENEVREFAPYVFVNIFILTAVLMLINSVRRRFTIDRSVKEIQDTLSKITGGDFSARLSITSVANKYDKLGEIVASINTLAEELGSVETLRTDFIANVSHEMKTPLAVIQNYGTLLQSEELSDETRIEYARAVTSGVTRLSSMMTNILKLNRLENQQIYPKNDEYDLSEQLCACLLDFENEWEKKGIELDTDIKENVTVKADAELLSLVWNNLFSNAFKFTDRGGCVSVKLTATDRHAVVTVSDTGCGMSQETGAHIFEKFYQGDSSHAVQGNGLGLALVKRVVDIMQGEIEVQSALAKGSTFTVRIRRNIYE